MILTDTLNVLLIEDNLAEARYLQEILKAGQGKPFNLAHVQRLQDALARLQVDAFDAILLDLTLPDSQGLNSLTALLKKVPNLPVVVLTNTNDNQLAIEAVRSGAQDYLIKRNLNLELLVRSVCYAIERKHSTEVMREINQKLQESVTETQEELTKEREINQLKTEFVSMLSHDFRNPLNTILLSAGLLEDNRDKLTPEQQLNYFKMIKTAIKNMDRLLTEVLFIGQADAGKLKCYYENIDLKQFCCQIIETLKLTLTDNHKIDFKVIGNCDRGDWDENLLRHILSNLLTNALKYSPNGGTVSFELIAQTEAMIFKISDRGIGIPSEDLKHLFKPFYRATNVENVPGTGLGLAIVQKCVECLGGAIAVESEVGQGTIFTVILPIQEHH